MIQGFLEIKSDRSSKKITFFPHGMNIIEENPAAWRFARSIKGVCGFVGHQYKKYNQNGKDIQQQKVEISGSVMMHKEDQEFLVAVLQSNVL